MEHRTKCNLIQYIDVLTDSTTVMDDARRKRQRRDQSVQSTSSVGLCPYRMDADYEGNYRLDTTRDPSCLYQNDPMTLELTR